MIGFRKELKNYPIFCPYHQLYLDEQSGEERASKKHPTEAEAAEPPASNPTLKAEPEGEGEIEAEDGEIPESEKDTGTSLSLTMDYVLPSLTPIGPRLHPNL